MFTVIETNGNPYAWPQYTIVQVIFALRISKSNFRNRPNLTIRSIDILCLGVYCMFRFVLRILQ